MTMQELRGLNANARLGPCPLVAHAITADFRSATEDVDEEEREYLALMLAAQESLYVIATTNGEPCRVVVSADVDDEFVSARSGAATAVEVSVEISLRQCSSVHVDDDAAKTAVSAAATSIASSMVSPDTPHGDFASMVSAGDLDDHELLWFATQEIPDLLS